MAKINHLEVKAVKYYPDHEGIGVPYGNLYYKNKKMGEFRTDAWGGPMVYTHTHEKITEKEVRKQLSNIVSMLGWDQFYDSFDILIGDLIKFKDVEKIFKKEAKKGQYLAISTIDRRLDPIKSNRSLGSDGVYYTIPLNLPDKEKKVAENAIKDNHPEDVIVFFKDLSDFTIL